MEIENMNELRLNLGCGNRKFEGWVNVDTEAACNPDMVLDLEQIPWPWPDDSVSAVRLIHVLEHLGKDTQTYLAVIRELWRVCRHGAQIQIVVPHPRYEHYISDPTHVRPVTLLGLQFLDKKLNRDWQKLGFANTPLALYINVDIRTVRVTYTLDEKFKQFAESQKWDAATAMTNAAFYNNAIQQMEAHCVVVKNEEPS